MIARALTAGIALLTVPAAMAAEGPTSPAAFRRLPALGRLVEGGMEKDYRFRTYLVSKRAAKGGAFAGAVVMRVQDISGGVPRRPHLLKWHYVARCKGDASTLGLTTRSIKPRSKDETVVDVVPGGDPGIADRTWYNVWHAVCRGEFNKYPRNQDE
jgi:hypothetical protein